MSTERPKMTPGGSLRNYVGEEEGSMLGSTVAVRGSKGKLTLGFLMRALLRGTERGHSPRHGTWVKI